MMQHRRIQLSILALALANLGACGGEPPKTDTAAANAGAVMGRAIADGSPSAAGTAPSAMSGTTPSAAAPPTGATHDVQMLGDAKGFRFSPATLTIKRGDAVRFTNVSGGPHNATFWPDSIPAGAQAQLTANMPDQMAALSGPLMLTPNQTYIVSFANVPAGTYKYFCTPHLTLGMKAEIVVQ